MATQNHRLNSRISQFNRTVGGIFAVLDQMDAEADQMRIELLSRYSLVELCQLVADNSNVKRGGDPYVASYVTKEIERRTQVESALAGAWTKQNCVCF